MRAINRKTGLALLILTFIVIMIFGLFTLHSLAKPHNPFEGTDEQELEYRHELKAVLKSCKASTAGINLTKRCNDGRTLEYEVVINLPKYFNTEEREYIREQLEAVDLGVDGATVRLSFSGNEE
ncbi:hypothetical protein SAMN02910339_02046 [Lachnospiraceae bacterium YSD2013]|nr:hypothetical protein SAMN02910339_02046 [Lachnospiraceae bacterium YSD2013]